MDLNKHLEFFNPMDFVLDPVHIIGCGAIGSNLADMLTRLGIPEIHLWDFDTVSPHNIANQRYCYVNIGETKLNALRDILWSINPELEIPVHDHGYTEKENLSGYVFLCVDNIELRHRIATEQMFNRNIKAMFDFRMGLETAQHYAADWSDKKQIESFRDTMNFSQEEGLQATPVSACGTTLSVITTVAEIVATGVANFMNFTKGLPLKHIIISNSVEFETNAIY